jgi:hypothetical protein
MSDQTYQINLDRTANQPVAEGMHTFRVVGVEEGEGAKGPFWKMICAPATAGEEGKTIFLFLSLSPQSRWKLESFLDAVKAPASGSAIVAQFLNREFRGKVTHEPYEGRMQAKITEFFPMTAPAAAPVAPVARAAAPVARPAVAKATVVPVVPKKGTGKGLPPAPGDEIPF